MVSSSLIVFLVASALAVGAYGQAVNVTNSATDYYLLAQRDLLNGCDVAQVQIDAMNARFADQLGLVQLQHRNLLDEINVVNNTYTELQVLNNKRKYCIQQNALQFVTVSSATTRLTACYTAAANLASSLTRTASNDLTYARNAVLITLPKGITTCNTANASNQTKLEECYIKEVTLATTNCNYYLGLVQVDLNKSQYDASVSMYTAEKCSFTVEKDVLTSVGKTQEAIQNCENTLGQNFTLTALSEVQRNALPSTLTKLIGP